MEGPLQVALRAYSLSGYFLRSYVHTGYSRSRAIRRVRTDLAAKGVLSFDKGKQLLTYIAAKGADNANG